MFLESLKYLGIIGFGLSVFMISYHYNKRFLEWLRYQSLGTRDYIAKRLSIMFIEISPSTVLIIQFVISFGFGFIAFAALIPKIIPGLLFGSFITIVGWKTPKPVVEWFYQRRVKKFTSQMIDGLGMISNALRSGLSIPQAIEIVVNEMPDPIRQEFKYVLNENQVGVSLEEAFNNLSKRIESDDVEMFVTSINILKDTGGNQAEAFDNIVYTMRERIRTEKKIESMIAQQLYQGFIILAVPPILAFILYNSDPDFMRPLFVTTPGWIVLFLIFILEAVGLIAILKVTKIDI